MFETAELGQKISKTDFRHLEIELRTALLQAQRQLQTAEHAVIVLISGVEGAGKGAVVDRLHQWLDARGIETHAFWDETDEEREHPRYWRFWRHMPPKGSIGIMFGSWYTQPIVQRAFGQIDEAEFERQLARIAQLEQMLAADGTRLVKLWFHLGQAEQQKRINTSKKKRRNALKKSQRKLTPQDFDFSKKYADFVSASERAIRLTDAGESPWHIIESSDANFRDATAARILLQTITHAGKPATPDTRPLPPTPTRTVLDTVDLDVALTPEQYKEKLKDCQARLHTLAWQAYEARKSLVVVLEGWDAAGKGGAIRRATQALDARLYRVISVAAPTQEEKAQHYLWRFWRHLPRGGYISIYDRSWYGRVLVERVEGFAKMSTWSRAYQEINNFEEQLLEGGIGLAKFWLHISKDEQLRRFKERETTAWKQHKITDEDWRNREQWEAYAGAINDMVAHTSTSEAPWTIVPGNDKRYARIEVLRTLCSRLERLLNQP